MVQPLWQTVGWFLTKLNILLPYNPAVTLLGIYPNELKMYVYTEICTWMFIVCLFIIAAKTWKMSFSRGWINELWYIRQWNIISFSAKMKRAIKSWKDMEENLNAYYSVKESNLKRLHMV